MRVAGLVLLACGLALGGDALAHGTGNGGPPPKYCHQGGTAYKRSDYCYTSCDPRRACDIEVCTSEGAWLTMYGCKVRDCRRLCP
ncbi:MAG: hypothetical protein ABR863_10865 [Roseiarcus sp.]|jgi:hypothetical protein